MALSAAYALSRTVSPRFARIPAPPPSPRGPGKKVTRDGFMKRASSCWLLEERAPGGLGSVPPWLLEERAECGLDLAECGLCEMLPLRFGLDPADPAPKDPPPVAAATAAAAAAAAPSSGGGDGPITSGLVGTAFSSSSSITPNHFCRAGYALGRVPAGLPGCDHAPGGLGISCDCAVWMRALAVSGRCRVGDADPCRSLTL